MVPVLHCLPMSHKVARLKWVKVKVMKQEVKVTKQKLYQGNNALNLDPAYIVDMFRPPDKNM